MIQFNLDDYNLFEIEKEAKLSEFKTKKTFEVRGLHQKENPPLGIRYNMDKNKSTEIQNELSSFFKNSGLIVDFDHHEQENFIICLREDIRKNVPLASSLIKTIVYHLEGRLELDSDFKILGLEKFVTTEV